MPIKIEAGRRWVEVDVVLPGTPEQLWTAFATGPGMGTWFTDTTIEERVGGKVVFEFGGGATSAGVVTSFQPPVRIAYEEYDWSEGAPPCVTEIVITSRKGGECVVRMVHSLFTDGAQWDDELEGFEGGWPGAFELLRVYLRAFAGKTGAVARVMKVVPGAHGEAFRSMTEALGLGGGYVGERRQAAAGVPAFNGVIERVVQGAKSCELMLRVDEPAALALFWTHTTTKGDTRVGVSFVHYGEDAKERARESEQAWAAALARIFGE